MAKFFYCIVIIFYTSFLITHPVWASSNSNPFDDKILEEFKTDDGLDNPLQLQDTTDLTIKGIDDIELLISLVDIESEPYNQGNYNKFSNLFLHNKKKDICVFCDGFLTDFSKYNNIKPVIIKNRALILPTVLAENIGADTEFGINQKWLRISFYETTIILTQNSKYANVNGKQILMDVPPQLINGKLMIPIRFVAQNLGKGVYWIPSKGIDIIAIYDKP